MAGQAVSEYEIDVDIEKNDVRGEMSGTKARMKRRGEMGNQKRNWLWWFRKGREGGKRRKEVQIIWYGQNRSLKLLFFVLLLLVCSINALRGHFLLNTERVVCGG